MSVELVNKATVAKLAPAAATAKTELLVVQRDPLNGVADTPYTVAALDLPAAFALALPAGTLAGVDLATVAVTVVVGGVPKVLTLAQIQTAFGGTSPPPPPPPPPAWSPMSITNLTEYWKPSPATTWQDAALSVPGAVNSPFRVLLDPKGTHPLSEVTNQPTLVQAGGIYYARFNGVTRLSSTAVTGRADFEVVTVFKWPYLLNASGAQQSFLFGREPTNPGTTGTRLDAGVQNNGVGRLTAGCYNTSNALSGPLLPGSVPPLTATYVLRTRWTFDGTLAAVAGSTTTTTGASPSTGAYTGPEGDGSWFMGQGSGTSTPTASTTLDVAEQFRTAGAISAGDWTQFQAYVTSTYGTTY